MTAKERIRKFVVEELGHDRPASDLADETSLIDNGVIDSLAIVKVVLFIEREFGIKVRDEDVLPASFDSIASIASFVEAKTGR
jgi:acyl carrier protein